MNVYTYDWLSLNKAKMNRFDQLRTCSMFMFLCQVQRKSMKWKRTKDNGRIPAFPVISEWFQFSASRSRPETLFHPLLTVQPAHMSHPRFQVSHHAGNSMSAHHICLSCFTHLSCSYESLKTSSESLFLLQKWVIPGGQHVSGIIGSADRSGPAGCKSCFGGPELISNQLLKSFNSNQGKLQALTFSLVSYHKNLLIQAM